jgi:uracil-DNA glycosylase
LVDFDDVGVVVIGQDPYYAQENQANGLAFAVDDGVDIPSSLRNIFKEIVSDVGVKPMDRTLISYARQGVFWLNTALTTTLGVPYAHGDLWKPFTDKVLEELGKRSDAIVFMLWGNKAKEKRKFIDTGKHYILEAAHPSGLSASRGFFGCKHFSQANCLLKKLGRKEIDWGVCE